MQKYTKMIESPCIGICQYNEHRICVGCKRTYREVGLWNEFTDLEKQSVLDRIFDDNTD